MWPGKGSGVLSGHGTLIAGQVRAGSSTKKLLCTIKPKTIIVIQHRDLDDMAAISILEAKVKAVINTQPSITGEYPVSGAMMLLRAGIPIYETPPEAFELFQDGSNLEISVNKHRVKLTLDNRYCILGARSLTIAEVLHRKGIAEENVGSLLESFIDNSLYYARKEKQFVIDRLPIPPLQTSIQGKHALVVVRGSGYKKDLQAIRDYIRDYMPVLIGVDGGADALLEVGYTPHLIVGDMDSVSDQALRSGAELVVHAYPDGNAPGMKRIKALGLSASIMPAPGTSEDIAMLIAYEKKAALIVTLGTHTHMIDFLQKGRKGMGSTLLVRMKIGGKLMDAKGVSKLYPKRVRIHNALLVPVSACFPFVMVAWIHPRIQHMLEMIWLYIKFAVIRA